MNTYKPDPAKLAELNRLAQAVADAQAALIEFKRAWVNADAPWKVGDKVPTCPGWGRKENTMIVTSVKLSSDWYDCFSFDAFGWVLKNDGTPSASKSSVTQNFEMPK